MIKTEKRIGKVVALASLMTATLLSVSVQAGPIKYYGVSNSAGTYVSLTNPTLMTLPEMVEEPTSDNGTELNNYLWSDASTPLEESISGEAFPIGFDFVYDNQVMNRFAIFSNLGIVLGHDSVELERNSNMKMMLANNYADDGKDIIQVGAFNGMILMDDSSIGYEVVGEAPYRTLVVEFQNIGVQLGWWGTDRPSVSLQMRLNETYNTVDLVFNNWDRVADCSNSTSVYVGMKGRGDDINARYTSDSIWGETTLSDDDRISYSSSSYPENGYTLTFSPCEDCVTPSANVSDLTATASTDIISGSFSAAEGVDSYLVTVYKASDAVSEPEDGVVYSAGSELGTARVLLSGSATEFSTEDIMDLEPVTDYVVRVYTYNENCMNGPKYNRVDVPSVLVQTCPAAPSSMTAVSKSPTSIEVSVEGNSNNDTIYVAMTDVKAYNTWGNPIEDGVFGTPSGDYEVGDEIEGGGKIVYVGKSDTFTVSDLEVSTIYHFAAFSRSEAGVYSTLYAKAGDVTYGELPYEIDLNDFWGDCEHGVEASGQFTLTKDFNRDLAYVGSTSANAAGTEGSITTQWIKSATEGTARLKFKCNQQTAGSRFSAGSPYNTDIWDERDSFVVEMTTDGENYTPIQTWTKENAPEYASTSDYTTLVVNFEPGMDTTFRLRIRFTTYIAIKTYIKDILVEEKPECDQPLSLAGTADCGDVTLSWTPMGDESQWALAWRESGTEEWSEQMVESPTATITGLKGITTYDFRVAAQCSASSRSEWSDEIAVVTGYAVPFEDNLSSLNENWVLADGAFEDGVIPSESASWQFYSRYKALLIYVGATVETHAWAITPSFDLGNGEQNYLFKFKVKNMTGNSEDAEPTIKLVVSKDGESFNTEDVILTLDKDEFADKNVEKEFTASLKGYTGKVRVGVLLDCLSNTPSLLLTSIAVEASCPNDVVITVGDVDHESAEISWEGTKDEDQSWMVKIRPEDGEWSEYTTTQENSMRFEGLELRTNYIVAVTKACADDDIAKPVEATFTTASTIPCYAVENVAAEATPYDITVSWEGDAYAYNVELTNVSTEEVVSVNTSERSYQFANLASGTAYSVRVQAVCSLADGDVSEWSEALQISTLEETCFAPSNIEVVPSYFSVEVSWEGSSDSYEVSFRVEGEEEWTVANTEESVMKITGLTPTTNYQLRVRGICGEDASRYSDVSRFATIAVPPCGTPTDLTVDSIDESSISMYWTAGDRNDSWLFNYRLSSATQWSSEVIDVPRNTITGLEEDSAYIWRVKGYCSEDDSESSWSAQERVSTTVGVASILNPGNLNVVASKNMISIINPTETLIDMVEVYNVKGAILKRLNLNTTDNVTFTMGLGNEVIVVRVYSGKQVASYRIAVK